MRDLLRYLAIVFLALLVPVVPFLLLGSGFEERVGTWFNARVTTGEVAAAVVGLLVSDMLLPIPSSLICTLAGARLGIAAGAAASWCGLVFGQLIGFALAKRFGEVIVRRFVSPADVARMRAASDRLGPAVLAVTRPLPILAEATVLLLGAAQLPWRKCLPTLLLSNLGIALLYAWLGRFAAEYNLLPVALVASVVLPLLVTLVVRYLLPTTSAATPVGDA